MTPINKLIGVARDELGYTEQPKDSNNTKYGQVYGLQGQPWCMIFLWWLFREAGLSKLFFDGQKTASCGMLLKWAKNNGMTVEPEDIQPGDIVILNFSGTQDTQHCGLVVDDLHKVCTNMAGTTFVHIFKTIEGNTTPGEEGSQDNGGSVALKTRYTRQVVGVIRPKYETLDYIGSWAEDDIVWGIENGLVRGYEDGSFRPSQTLTRAEMLALLRRYDNYRFGGSSK